MVSILEIVALWMEKEKRVFIKTKRGKDGMGFGRYIFCPQLRPQEILIRKV